MEMNVFEHVRCDFAGLGALGQGEDGERSLFLPAFGGRYVIDG